MAAYSHKKHLKQHFNLRKRFSRFLHILGPGIVTGAADDDPSGIATYSQAGATTGSVSYTHLDVYKRQLLMAVESYSGRVESIRSAYGTVANNTLNQRMKTLTVFTVMIALPNLFYGMYGMNVDGLPFHDMPWGYLFVLGLSVFITLLTFAIAKRLRIF